MLRTSEKMLPRENILEVCKALGQIIKTPLSSVEKKMEFWGAIVGIGGPSKRARLWAMPEDEQKPKDD